MLNQEQKIDLLVELVGTLRDELALTNRRLDEALAARRIPLTEAAERLDLHPDTLRRLVSSRKIQCCPRVDGRGRKGARGGAIYFLEEHLKEFEDL